MVQELRAADLKEIKPIFEAQKAHQYTVANTSARERIKKLNRLHDATIKYKQEIRDALYQDMGKPEVEVDMTEIYAITGAVKHTRRNLPRWMATQKVSTPLSLLGSSSRIQYEPKGVCLIIAPWNFPVQLTLGPLVSAIAAGNTVILKPSEHTPQTAKVMQKIIAEIFDPREVAMFQGGAETAQALLKLPFNHIFFTGSPAIGKIIMAAAAKNLASVTLELGGKSPTIIDQTANLNVTVARLTMGKFVNSGQVCIAPDYVFVHESKKQSFLELLSRKLKESFGEDASLSKDYSRMINRHHFERVKSYLENAVSKGAKIVSGGQMDSEQNYIEPTVVTDVPMDSDLMQNEIFGPVLPVHTYRNLQEVIDLINSGEKPLALYIYSKSKKNIRHILKNTRAGGTCINNNDVHFYNHNLPFGGSNNSGIGKAHGWFGFEAFSDARAVYQQNIPGAIDFLTPPHNDLKKKLVDWTIKWF